MSPCRGPQERVPPINQSAMKATLSSATLLGFVVSSAGAFSLTSCADTKDYHNHGSNANRRCKTFRVASTGGWYYSSKEGCKLTAHSGSIKCS
ncbi:hypothetical protein F5X96DRAFT_670686 [Biscogniauxia mediterranea]|nr:hypothetical protein F5X96DRAFT_670686 [Biscogniauxia mediterranea]